MLYKKFFFLIAKFQIICNLEISNFRIYNKTRNHRVKVSRKLRVCLRLTILSERKTWRQGLIMIS